MMMERTLSARTMDRVRGSLIGGAVGDALGWPVEFQSEGSIFSRYDEGGITEYDLNAAGVAEITDDTQMTLFTANGILYADANGMPARRGIAAAYQDWLTTQTSHRPLRRPNSISWLMDVPELFNTRAPGNTCLSALRARREEEIEPDDYLAVPLNHSKGCGGVMRAAPMGLARPNADRRELAIEGAQLTAITHGHALGWLPSAMLACLVNRAAFGDAPLRDDVIGALGDVGEAFRDEPHMAEFANLIERAVALSENDKKDLDNIHALGEGWVGDEAIAIAVYCALRHADDFSACVISAVNHKGDSDSTGAIAGNIVGAKLGLTAIDPRWTENLELKDVLIEMADDLCRGGGDAEDADWARKYKEGRR